MNIIKNMTIVAFLFSLVAFNTAFADNLYVIDEENSIVNFSITREQYIIEPAVFQDVSGSIDKNGNIKISIDINSVDSSNPIRDNRLIDIFFQAEFFPEAIITAEIEQDILNSTEQIQQIELPATLEFYEAIKDITLHLLVVRSGDNLIVSSLQPIIIDGKRFGIPAESLNTLSKLCGGIAISDVVPVNFVLTFNKY